MKRTTVDELHKEWLKRPDYRLEYVALVEEFSHAATIIEGRSRAGLHPGTGGSALEATQAPN